MKYYFLTISIVLCFCNIGLSKTGIAIKKPPQEISYHLLSDDYNFPQEGLIYVHDRKVQEYVTSITNHLIKAMNEMEIEDAIKEKRQPRLLDHYNMEIIHDKNVNAQATEIEDTLLLRIYIGYIRYCENENELAGTLAHELNHWLNGDTKKGYKPIGEDYFFNQEIEKAADRGEQRLLVRAGYDPYPKAKFWGRVYEDQPHRHDHLGVLNSLISTHPGHAQREYLTSAEILTLKETESFVEARVVPLGISHEYLDELTPINEAVRATPVYPNLHFTEKIEFLIEVYRNLSQQVKDLGYSDFNQESSYDGLYRNLEQIISNTPTEELVRYNIQERFFNEQVLEHGRGFFMHGYGFFDFHPRIQSKSTSINMLNLLGERIDRMYWEVNEKQVRANGFLPETNHIWDGFSEFRTSKGNETTQQSSEIIKEYLGEVVGLAHIGESIPRAIAADHLKYYIPAMRTLEELDVLMTFFSIKDSGISRFSIFNQESFEVLLDHAERLSSPNLLTIYSEEGYKRNYFVNGHLEVLTANTISIFKRFFSRKIRAKDQPLATRFEEVISELVMLLRIEEKELSSKDLYTEAKEIRKHIVLELKDLDDSNKDAKPFTIESLVKLEGTQEAVRYFMEDKNDYREALELAIAHNLFGKDQDNKKERKVQEHDLLKGLRENRLIPNTYPEAVEALKHVVQTVQEFELDMYSWWEIRKLIVDSLTNLENIPDKQKALDDMYEFGVSKLKPHDFTRTNRSTDSLTNHLIYPLYTICEQIFYSKEFQERLRRETTIENKLNIVLSLFRFDRDINIVIEQHETFGTNCTKFSTLIFDFLDKEGLSATEMERLCLLTFRKFQAAVYFSKDSKLSLSNYGPIFGYDIKTRRKFEWKMLRETQDFKEIVYILSLTNDPINISDNINRDFLAEGINLFIYALSKIDSVEKWEMYFEAYYKSVHEMIFINENRLQPEESLEIKELSRLHRAIYNKWQKTPELNQSISAIDVFLALTFQLREPGYVWQSEENRAYNPREYKPPKLNEFYLSSPSTDELLRDHLFEQHFANNELAFRRLLEQGIIYNSALKNRYLMRYIDVFCNGGFTRTRDIILATYPDASDERDEVIEYVTKHYAYEDYESKEFYNLLFRNVMTGGIALTETVILHIVEVLNSHERLELLLWLNDLDELPKHPSTKSRTRHKAKKVLKHTAKRETKRPFSLERAKNIFMGYPLKERRLSIHSFMSGRESILKNPETKQRIKQIFLEKSQAPEEVLPFYEAFYDGLGIDEDSEGSEIERLEEKAAFIARIFPELAKYQDNPPQIARLMIDEMGIIGIKLAQILSMQHGLIPDEYIAVFAEFQDKAPSIAPYEAIKMLRLYYAKEGQKLEDVLIVGTELASASVKIVYDGVLKETGEEVVIKMMRERIAERIRQVDIPKLRAMRDRFTGERFERFRDLIDMAIREIEWMLFKEIDFMREIQNAKRFAKNIEVKRVGVEVDRNGIKIRLAKVYEEYSNGFVIVETKAPGKSLKDLDLAPDKKLKLYETLFERSLRTVFIDQFTDPDRHRGNFKYVDGELWFIDFGQGFRVSNLQRNNLINFFVNLKMGDADSIIDNWLAMVKKPRNKKRMEDFKAEVMSLFSDERPESSELFKRVFEASNRNTLAFKRGYFHIFKMFSFLQDYAKELPAGYMDETLGKIIWEALEKGEAPRERSVTRKVEAKKQETQVKEKRVGRKQREPKKEKPKLEELGLSSILVPLCSGVFDGQNASNPPGP